MIDNIWCLAAYHMPRILLYATFHITCLFSDIILICYIVNMLYLLPACSFIRILTLITMMPDNFIYYRFKWYTKRKISALGTYIGSVLMRLRDMLTRYFITVLIWCSKARAARLFTCFIAFSKVFSPPKIAFSAKSWHKCCISFHLKQAK